jgi:ribosomal protein S18 acetylase RimI-like enzyme
VSYTVRRSRPEDWRDLRAVRLAALADTPTAFVTTLAQAAAYSDEEWQRRAGSHQPSGAPAVGFLAYTAAGEPVGMLGGGVVTPQRALVWGVWVAPEHRGGGLAEQLMAAIEDWARDEAGVSELMLEVNEQNSRARAFYSRLGFVANGNRQPYPNDPSVDELEMVKALR